MREDYIQTDIDACEPVGVIVGDEGALLHVGVGDAVGIVIGDPCRVMK
jgi:hypothetical protein